MRPLLQVFFPVYAFLTGAAAAISADNHAEAASGKHKVVGVNGYVLPANFVVCRGITVRPLLRIKGQKADELVLVLIPYMIHDFGL